MKLFVLVFGLLTACGVSGSPTYFPACPRGVGLGEVFSTDGCNDCLCARTGPACTGYTCMQCRAGQIFYRDMCNKCLCGLKGTYACESNPCHQEMFGARWLMEWNLLYRMLFWMKDFFAIREDGRDQTLYARINTSLEFALSSSYGSDTFLVLYQCDHFFLTPLFRSLITGIALR